MPNITVYNCVILYTVKFTIYYVNNIVYQQIFYILLDIGVEGETFRTERNAAGQIVYVSIWEDEQFQPGIRTEGLTFAHGAATQFTILQDITTYEFAERYFTPEAFGVIPYTNPIFGSFPDDIRDIATAMGTRYDEARNHWITGQRPFNDVEVDALIEELRSLGLDRWLEVAQQWYDENF